jgi:hypothetical protein
MTDVAAMVETLSAAGYLVVKIPPCDRRGGHGRHALITRTAQCDGVEPIPHGFHSTHRRLFGYGVTCACGGSFSDYSKDGEPSAWAEHKAQHGIQDEEVRSAD